MVDKPFHVSTNLDFTAICQLMADRAIEPLTDPALGHPAKVELLLCGGDSHWCYTCPEFYSGDRSLNFVRTLFGWTLGGTVHSQASRAIVSRTSQPSAKPDPECSSVFCGHKKKFQESQLCLTKIALLSNTSPTSIDASYREHMPSHCL